MKKIIHITSVMLSVLFFSLTATGWADQALTVSVSPAGAGYVESWPEGIWCPDGDCTWEFSEGEEVWLTAHYNSGYQFDHWEGDLTSTADSSIIVMNSAKNVTAVFVPVQNPQTLTVSVSPAGAGYVESWPGGIWCPDGACIWEFPEGGEVYLTANYNAGYQFDHWEGDFTTSTENTSMIIMDSAKSVTAVFVPIQNPQTLTVSVSPSAGGNVGSWPIGIWCPDGECAWDFPEGVEVILTAEYYSGYQFDHWEGDLTGTSPSQTIIMDSAKSVTAVFVPVQVPQTLTVSVSPTGGGHVYSSPGGIYCPGGECTWEFPQGAEVILNADYNSGYQFDHWEGDLTGTSPSRTIIMDSAKSVTAIFVPVQTPQTLTVSVSPAGAGHVESWPAGIYCPDGDCTWEFPEGEEVWLTVNYNSGYQFDHWEGDLTATGIVSSIVMDSAKTVTAVFVPVQNPQNLTVSVSPPGAGYVESWPAGIYCPDGDCTWEFPEGGEVWLTAHYNSGYQFDHWEGDLTTEGSTSRIVMDSAKTVTAVFVPAQNPQPITVSVSPVDSGHVYSSPEGIYCPGGDCTWEFPEGAEVVLNAEYNSGYQFDHWEGDLTGISPFQTIVMDSAKRVKAIFIRITDPQRLTISVSPPGAGIVESWPGGIWCPQGACT